MGGGKLPELKDWTEYKIDGIKPLENLREKLAEKGLKDPWIRNEVWRFETANRGGAVKHLRVVGYSILAAACLLTIRHNFLPRDKHGEPYLL